MARQSQQAPEHDPNEDINLTDFDVSDQLYWPGDGFPAAAVPYDAGQADYNLGSANQQHQPQRQDQQPFPMSPWSFEDGPWPIQYVDDTETAEGSFSKFLQDAYDINGEHGFGIEQCHAPPTGFPNPQADMLTPESMPSVKAYEAIDEQDRSARVNEGMSHPGHRASKHPTRHSPTLLPREKSIVQSGAGQGQRPTGSQGPAARQQQQQQRQRQDVREFEQHRRQHKELWDYAIEVVPADPDDSSVLDHIVAVHEQLAQRSFGDYRFEVATSTHFGRPHQARVRRYILPDRLRRDDRARMQFMQVFNSSRSHNSKLQGYEFKMVQVFEPRQFHTPNDDYQAIAGLGDDDDRVGVDSLPQFGDNDITDLAAYAGPAPPPFPSPEPHHDLHLPPLPPVPEQPTALPTPKDDLDIHTTQRSKPIPKPDRQVRKNARGKYECTWDACDEKDREFNRKCEWNKHMDKHERPYKCQVEGCEKLAGFTYSGGLLRHEREVHSKHGGPRNPLNCPHVTCKRHNGKGFSRLENLNEHLRRVHTHPVPGVSGDDTAEDGDSVAASESGQVLPQQILFPHQPQQTQPSPQVLTVTPQKRPLDVDEDTDIQSEVKRLRQSEQHLKVLNEELARQLTAQQQQAEQNSANLKQELEAQKRHMAVMMAELANMRQQVMDSEQQTQAESLLTDAFT
ncbi:hypothetical protein BKA67DRAFT_675913 [Truncatella angustata]|uniref:C2H2-type domain-containing protein n=1 Tax=Truncatella angustata TaxID=152316 RepID=A0A9P8UPY2_9PEZI|nr:uncharacterized protein BKA67DRAFT_675913 [Truncatella angustata]KAH6655909.1 hypothetical protein BKA67DRAFT_675913 [Truncatella angustata]